MTRYHFHVQLADRLIPDREGVDLPSLRSAFEPDNAGACAPWDALLDAIGGMPNRITVITDEAGRIVFVLAV
ncbi:DUF6894 family protein [Microvirga yunnanensis]|uniref:DUF6894 family protein n=1 Tax=Microvirga yunnanensis TaxID=2953740 RepID=UPI0021C76355|nr:hypothetical protein [Microvirga sp. HBU65207]